MKKADKDILRGLDGLYNRKRLDAMGVLQNKLVKTISKESLTLQDVHMVLVTLQRQVEELFARSLVPVKKSDVVQQEPILKETEEGIGVEIKNGRNVEKS